MGSATDTQEQKILDWRKSMFQEMGFESEDAIVLSLTQCQGPHCDGVFISTHAVRKMLQAGCTPDLVLKIIT